MIETVFSVWFLAGLAVGMLHAALLWRGSRRMSVWTPLVGMLRLGMVAAVLVAAAVFGSILPAAAGWLLGLWMLGAGLLAVRTRQPSSSGTATE